jgi:lipoyl-dependent peroxiredoxin
MAILYTANVTNTGGRVGQIKSEDGILDMAVSKPVEMNGTGGATNPEQLFAAAYATCYGGAVKFLAEKQGVILPEDWAVEAQVSMNQEGGSMFLSVKIIAKFFGVEKQAAEKLATTAYHACPYTRATKGNIESSVEVLV